jgi:hypothetical protein
MDLDEHTLGVCLATIAAALVGSLPTIIRVVRMSRVERTLRLDQHDRNHN